ncbi:MAG: PQQ-binding-like beta-propeller repeat protein [Gemmataceae bacterium]
MTIARPTGVVLGCLALCAAAAGQDWPQWRGPNRDAKATGFTAPKTWPKELTQKWKITVGDGVATPALVGDKLFVFTRQDGNEVIRCVNAADGKTVWEDKYATGGVQGPAGGFTGPRCSPAVADGKVVTLGVHSVLSCYDTAGKKLWRKDDFKDALPRFYPASSPMIVEGLCIVQLGGENSGAIIAYDINSGDEKWKWTGDGTTYASPVLLTVGGTKVIVAETAGKIVCLGLDGKPLWDTKFKVRYNASTPVVEGQTIIYSGAGLGAGTKAVKVEKKGDMLTANELWSNPDTAVQFNTPVVKNGLVFGVSDRNTFFCISMEDGKTAWTAPAPQGAAGGGPGGGRPGGPPPGGPPPGGGGRPGGGRMGGGMGGGGYGSVVDAGSVLFALTPAGKLVVYEPSGKEFKQLANYKVAEAGTYAYPIISGNRVFIKDRDSLTLWTID